MGKQGFIHLKEIVAKYFKKYGPAERVTRNRYRFGLILFILPLLMAWTLPYVGHLLPFYQENLLTFSIAGDVLFVSSLFVLGGEFWDKLQALFVYEANVEKS